ncbi:MAG: cyclic pyranopterin monophosphate synthase MoaC [Dehalococcoidales bacterium]|nr:cyclic pyranopterin monophosphate synthase MoaC [Dehalococcoidales bacterium]
MKDNDFSHLDEKGSANMVDISSKNITKREALASCKVFLSKAAFNKVRENDMSKGNVINIAKIAGIMASKKTHDLIPLCHQVPLNKVDLNFQFDNSSYSIYITSKATTDWKTGVEMEALTAVSLAALTIYDMCKSIDKTIKITDIQLEKKSGGKSGNYNRK